jgi:hypothetical protein
MSIPYENPVDEVQEKPSQPEKKMESSELHKLFEALAKAQLEMEIAKTDRTNPYYKSRYADLRSVVEASRPVLAKNGLCVIQRTLPGKNGNSYLNTRLGHSSGQWMESLMVINPPKQDIQTLGSYMTYLRRYSYASMVGVVTGEEDDDGENAMERPAAKDVPSSTITKSQLQTLASELKGETEMVEQIFKSYGISKLADIPLQKYEKCLTTILEIKKTREGEKK